MTINREPIAIIGIGCRYPGGVSTPEEYWQLLMDGRDAVGEIAADRWSVERHFNPEPGVAGKTYSRWAGLIDDIKGFEPERFGISPREAHYIDPQQRLLLECAAEAFEDAGIPSVDLAGSRTGVYVGVSTSDYAQLQQSPVEGRGVTAHTATGGVLSIAANRLSYCFNLHGPSMAVDTACSSSLVATDLACRAIWTGEAEMALVGGVNLIMSPAPFIAFSAASMLSPDGRCKSFDAEGNGFVRGEGAGVVLLKPYAQALADQDRIYAVIRGSGTNEDGRTTGIVMPSAQAQQVLLEEVYRDAGINPRDVSYVEAHGTGTAIGDPIEAKALGAALGVMRGTEESPLLIGSVKSNIGHLEAGAGMAGLIKAALVLHHRAIPKNLHFQTPNPRIPFAQLGLEVVQAETAFPQERQAPIFAGVNSFGFGGANAHVALQSHVAATPSVQALHAAELAPQLLCLSASCEESLRSLAQAYLQMAAQVDGPSLYEICRSTAQQRNHLRSRLALVVLSKHELIEYLQAWLNGERRPSVFEGQHTRELELQPVFVLSGQGPQWWGMGRELLQTDEVFRDLIKRCDKQLLDLGGWSLWDELTASENESRMADTAISQPALFALQVGCVRVLEAKGITPTAVIGHSVGEVAAAHIAGVLTLEDAVRVIYHRGRTMAAAPGGRMLALGLSGPEAEELIAPYVGRVALAALNGPKSVTLSGDADALEELAKNIENSDVFCRFLPVQYAFHSHHMEPVRDDLLASLAGIRASQPTLDVVSTVRGSAADDEDFGTEYWWHNIREPVRFSEGIGALAGAGFQLFIEISPHPVLASSISQNLRQLGVEGAVIPTLRRDASDLRQILSVLANLYCAGYALDWARLWPDQSARLALPLTPWDRKPYWHEPLSSLEFRCGSVPHPLLERSLNLPNPSWETALDIKAHAYLRDHRVQGLCVFPGAGYVEMAIAAATVLGLTSKLEIHDLQFGKAIFVSETDEDQRLLFSVNPDDKAFEICSRVVGKDDDWVGNVRGYLAQGSGQAVASPLDESLLQGPVIDELDAAECYQNFQSVGLHYGEAFRGVQRIIKREACALGLVELPAAATLPDSSKYWLHPALLDACFQVMLGMLPRGTQRVYLPVQIDRVRLHKKPGQRVRVVAVCHRLDDKSVLGDLQVYAEDGTALISIEGFLCKAVAMGGRSEGQHISDWLYHMDWELVRKAPALDADFLTALFEPLSAEPESTAEDLVVTSCRSPEIRTDLEKLTFGYVIQAAVESWEERDELRQVSLAKYRKRGTIQSAQISKLYSLLELFEARGWLLKDAQDSWMLVDGVDLENPKDLYGRLIFKHPAHYAELTLIRRSGDALVNGNSAELDDEGQRLLEHWHQDSPLRQSAHAIFERQVMRAVEILPLGRELRVLEIGAGHAGLTARMLPLMPADRCHYVRTDVTEQRLQDVSSTFKKFPFLHTALFDLEASPIGKGLELASFDIVLLSDPLRDSRLLESTLQYVHALLAPGGVLLMGEAATTEAWMALVFGGRCSTSGIRASASAGQDKAATDLYLASGFSAPLCLAGAAGQGEHLVSLARTLAAEDSIHSSQEGAERHIETPGMPEVGARHWLIFADKLGFGDALAQTFKQRGISTTLVRAGPMFTSHGPNLVEIREQFAEDYVQLLSELSLNGLAVEKVVYCWPLNATQQENVGEALELCASLTCLVQALAEVNCQPSAGLLLASQYAQAVEGGDSVHCHQTATLAMGRVVANEYPGLRYQSVDLDRGDVLTQVHLFLDATDIAEDELALRGQALFAPRLSRQSTTIRSRDLSADMLSPSMSIGLTLGDSGTLDALRISECGRVMPGPGEVEVEVTSAALNFRDVLKTLNLYPADGGDAALLGDEFSGRVTAVGSEIEHLQVGQAVFGLASASFKRHIVTRGDAVMPIPSGLSYDEAASIPITFLTAHYALNRLAHIDSGDSILIQAGAGGVGLAALQIAKQAGATVYATAGTADKRALLHSLGAKAVMDSRSLSFASELMEYTQGRGVDIVLNSLAGEALHKGIECLAPFGRFLELGKRDIYENKKIGLWAFRRNLAFFGIDLSRMMAEKPALIEVMMREIAAEFESGHYQPLPHRVFSLGRVRDAFRYMAQGQHTGKVILSLQSGVAQVEETAPSPFELKGRQGSFLITGGLSGFGFAIAQWLVRRGATALILVSRRGQPDVVVAEGIEQMRAAGVRVEVLAVDVSDRKQVDALLSDLTTSMPQLSGVFHAAMVLDDGMLMQLSRERLSSVLAPKVTGCLNLHEATIDLSLQYFVMFSSASAIAGNLGQANYVAANGFLDAFAHYRRSLGLAALSVNWGRIAEVGVVERSSVVGDSLDKRGFLGLSPAQATDALELLLQSGLPQGAAMRMDWQAIQNLNARGGASKRYERLLVGETQSERTQERGAVRKLIEALPLSERYSSTLGYVTKQASAVLGVPAERLNPDELLNELGLDSLMAVELINQVEAELDVSLPTAKVIQNPTITNLITMALEHAGIEYEHKGSCNK